MKKSLAALVLLALAAPASAQDDKAPPAPAPPAGGYTPQLPSPSTPAAPAPALSEERIAVLIDQAVNRALARQAAYAPPQASAQGYAPATGSPQNAYGPPPQQPFTSYLATAPANPVAQINVLVPPGALHQACARLGARLSAKGAPKLRTMTIAPQASVPTYTLTPAPTPAPAPVAANPVYTPPLPAQYVQPTPAAPAKASAQR